MAELVVEQNNGTIRHVLADSVTVGRSATCAVRIDDTYVSKVHSIITRRGEGFFIRDLKSANRTRLNGNPIDDEVMLQHGDELVFGTTRSRFLDELAQKAAAPLRADHNTVLASGTSVETRFVAAKDEFAPERTLKNDEQLRRDYEKLRISYELTNALAGELNFDQVLSRGLDTLIKLFKADRGVVLLLEHDRLRPRCGRDSQGQNRDVPFSNTIVSEVLATRSSILSFDAAIDSRFKAAESVMAQGIRSSMAAPLMRADEVLGVIVLDCQIAAGMFTEKDLRILQTAANQAAVALHNSMLAKRLADEAVVRQRFQKLLAPNLVERIVDGSLSVERAGEMRDVTVLFSDIRGFTAFSETRSPDLIVKLLNEYFEEMVEIVFANEGTLDKFVGDEIMALFGAPVEHADDAERAVRTAVEMLRALKGLNERFAELGEPPFLVGIGINTGNVVSGFIGSSKALEYTVIGDVVNTGARFCGQAAADEILIGLSTYEKVKGKFDIVEKPPVTVKNKAQPLRIFSVRW